MISLYQAAAFDKLGLSCLFPKLRRPFEPLFNYLRCKLGLAQDQYMEAPGCDPKICTVSDLEEREITMSKPIPSLELMDMSVETIDDCFDDMNKIVYGVRVLMKNIDDDSCEDPRFGEICDQLYEEGKVLIEENCVSPRYEDIL